jgi:hypothetical protein
MDLFHTTIAASEFLQPKVQWLKSSSRASRSPGPCGYPALEMTSLFDQSVFFDIFSTSKAFVDSSAFNPKHFGSWYQTMRTLPMS